MARRRASIFTGIASLPNLSDVPAAMPLVACPDCKEKISDAAPACIHCGRPSQRHAAPQEPVAAMENLFASIPFFAEPATAAVTVGHGGRPPCPRCGSPQVRSLKAIYSGGISESHTTGTFHADLNGDGRRERGRTSHTTRSQTAASRAASPPHETEAWAGFILLFIAPVLGLMIGVLVAGPFGLVLGPLLAFWGAWRYWAKLRRYNREEYPVLMERWNNSYRCQGCAHVFVHEPGRTPA